jgi:hypothetical protein
LPKRGKPNIADARGNVSQGLEARELLRRRRGFNPSA